MNPQLYDYQLYTDQVIDRHLRASLGNTDANRFKILLPLSGTFDIVDIQQMVVQLQMDSQIERAADDLVIALFFQDKAENYGKAEKAEAYLIDLINKKLGAAISTDYDLTTAFLIQDYFTWDDGVPWALEDDSGLILASNLKRTPNSINSRIIFVPRESL